MTSELNLSINDLYRICSESTAATPQKNAFFHVVNPLTPKSTSDLSYAQPVTLKAMQHSASFTQIANSNIEVTQLAAAFREDVAVIPVSFVTLPCLDRDVTDMAMFQVPRPLPLLWDILERAVDHIRSVDREGETYVIYTNIDIATMPQFYLLVNKIAELGIDAFCINRRSVSNVLRDFNALPLLASEFGEIHPGFDCIVFKSQLFDLFCPFESCLGAIHVMRPLLINLMALADKFRIFTDLHATFHIGNDAVWDDSRFNDYESYNMEQVVRVFNHCIQDAPGKEKLIAYSSDIDWIWLRERLGNSEQNGLRRIRKFFKKGLKMI